MVRPMKPGARVLAILVACLLPTSPCRACPGDCGGDGRVNVAELILAVRIALGQEATDLCPDIDVDRSGEVAIAELIAAVRAALEGCAQLLAFDPPRRYPTGDSPRSLAVADLDGDEWPDIVAANHISHDVSILLNDGTGAFLPHTTVAVGFDPARHRRG